MLSKLLRSVLETMKHSTVKQRESEVKIKEIERKVSSRSFSGIFLSSLFLRRKKFHFSYSSTININLTDKGKSDASCYVNDIQETSEKLSL